MRVLFIAIMLCFPFSAFGFNYECETKTYDGKEVTLSLVSSGRNYIMSLGPSTFDVKLIEENKNYIHFIGFKDQLSIHIGINKNINYMIMDGMDLKSERPSNRVTGYCSKF